MLCYVHFLYLSTQLSYATLSTLLSSSLLFSGYALLCSLASLQLCYTIDSPLLGSTLLYSDGDWLCYAMFTSSTCVLYSAMLHHRLYCPVLYSTLLT